MAIQALENRIHRLEHILKSGPRSWHFYLEQGQTIPSAVQRQLAPADSVFIRHYPRGYFGDEDSSSTIGHVTDERGTRSIRPDGRIETIPREIGRMRR